MIIAAVKLASKVVMGLFTREPMMSLRRVNITRGIMANGRPKESTTWLMTSVRVGSSPMKMTINDGTIVTIRLIQGGI